MTSIGDILAESLSCFSLMNARRQLFAVKNGTSSWWQNGGLTRRKELQPTGPPDPPSDVERDQAGGASQFDCVR